MKPRTERSNAIYESSDLYTARSSGLLGEATTISAEIGCSNKDNYNACSASASSSSGLGSFSLGTLPKSDTGTIHVFSGFALFFNLFSFTRCVIYDRLPLLALPCHVLPSLFMHYLALYMHCLVLQCIALSYIALPCHALLHVARFVKYF